FGAIMVLLWLSAVFFYYTLPRVTEEGYKASVQDTIPRTTNRGFGPFWGTQQAEMGLKPPVSNGLYPRLAHSKKPPPIVGGNRPESWRWMSDPRSRLGGNLPFGPGRSPLTCAKISEGVEIPCLFPELVKFLNKN
ncbi:hypothetical protein, partial [Laspinema olomoucense]